MTIAALGDQLGADQRLGEMSAAEFSTADGGQRSEHFDACGKLDSCSCDCPDRGLN